MTALLDYYNAQYPVTYRRWFESLYQDKYFYMGEADLMAAALLLDVASYYAGIVLYPLYRDPEYAFAHLPFEGQPGRVAARMMKFYRKRLVILAKNRAAALASRRGEFRLARALRWLRARFSFAQTIRPRFVALVGSGMENLSDVAATSLRHAGKHGSASSGNLIATLPFRNPIGRTPFPTGTANYITVAAGFRWE